jgi:hypothetical protein
LALLNADAECRYGVVAITATQGKRILGMEGKIPYFGVVPLSAVLHLAFAYLNKRTKLYSRRYTEGIKLRE